MTCPSGKRAYRRFRDARKALRRIQSYGAPVRRAYRCDLCDAYHLTSQPRRHTA